MDICAVCFTRAGVELAEGLGIEKIYAFHKYAGKHISFTGISEIMPVCWRHYRNILFIGACGIAVRAIAPFVVDKQIDPAVVVCDDRGQNVISLVAGHIGGANRLARKIAEKTGGRAVITTATDVNEKFAADLWAAENNLYITDMDMVKKISAALLNNEAVGFYSKLYETPEGLFDNGRYGIYAGYNDLKPFDKTLVLVPKCIVAGIGCKKGVDKDTIKAVLMKVLDENNINVHSIYKIASIDLKKDEKGLVELAEEMGVDFDTYSAQELNSLKGDFSQSVFVEEATGVDCVCERACAANFGKVIVKKYSEKGVTVALGENINEL